MLGCAWSEMKDMGTPSQIFAETSVSTIALLTVSIFSAPVGL